MSDHLFGSKSFEPPTCWHDREIRFDSGAHDIEARQGEETLDTLVRQRGIAWAQHLVRAVAR